MAEYRFVTHWRFDAPLERVWTELDTPERYPEWWPSMRVYRDLTHGMHGVGARAERVTKGALPYSLRYVTTVTHYKPMWIDNREPGGYADVLTPRRTDRRRVTDVATLVWPRAAQTIWRGI
jgi:uncharacterized protein YndB with AHSA1/START domain